jgi:mannose-1-phosphate guanylyltransferase
MATTSKRPEHLKHTYVCLLAGGTGTRLWPRSRKATPKQFTDLFENLTLFQQTIRRIKGVLPLSHVYVITNKRYIHEVQKEEPLLPEDNIIGEPFKRNTAMAIGTVAALVYKRDPKAVVINLASDHQIKDLTLYRKTISKAAKIAFEKNKIVTIGIEPEFPHTGMGHIERGEHLYDYGSTPVYKVASFKEKPDLATAKRFTTSGRYYWNSNKFVFPAKLMLDEFKLHSKDLYELINKFYNAIGTHKQNRVMKTVYKQAPDIAIDYAVAEKSKNMLLIPGTFGWSDVGDWKVVYDLSAKDKNGNVVIKHGREGQFIGLDTSDSLIQFDDQMIVTIGVKDLVIVDTKGALLICHKDRAEEVKKVVEILKEKKLKEYL